MKAAALLVDWEAQKIFVKFYLLVNKPNVPQEVFTNREKALEWVKKYK
jgi:hypothetical protein